MRRIFLLSIAAVSLTVLVSGARRPRYGGLLRMQIHAAVPAIDHRDWPWPALASAPGAQGPFRMSNWKAGEFATFIASEEYPGPHPYLEGIEVRMGRTLAQQAIDFEVGKADVIEVSPASARPLKGRGAVIAMTRPNELLALVCDGCPPGLGLSLGLSIDREAIHNVILQRTGEISGALVPQWLGGYAFLFAPTHDVSRARQAAGGKPVTLTFSYDREDFLARSIAERIAVNAMEAGITLRPSEVAAGAQVRLVRLAIHGGDPAAALADLAAALKIPLPGVGDPFEAEREMLAGSRVIPLFHLPHVYQLSPRVKNWPAITGSFADTWLTGAPAQ